MHLKESYLYPARPQAVHAKQQAQEAVAATKSMTVPPQNQLKQLQQEAKKQFDTLKHQLGSADQQAKASNEATKVLIKCLIIATRIMAGDEVPKEDHRYLAKHDMKLYSKAISMRITREKPQKHKRISEDECKKKRSDFRAKTTERKKSCLPLKSIVGLPGKRTSALDIFI